MPSDTYWQGSSPRTNDETFDDQIRSVKCGIPEFGDQIAYPTLCYDHLTVTRHEVTGETPNDYRITAECSWTGSEPEWTVGQTELKSVNYPFISSVIVNYTPPVPQVLPPTVYEEPNCQGQLFVLSEDNMVMLDWDTLLPWTGGPAAITLGVNTGITFFGS